MGREKRIYTVGDYWLGTRPESPFYQIFWYDAEARTTRHRSTGCEELEGAKAAIHSFDTEQRAKGRQDIGDATAVPLLMLYWDEHGRKAINAAQIASSLRQFIAFLRQDKATIGVTVQALTPDVFRRFIRWRMGPHSYSIRWQGKDYAHSSAGVSGESVSRNLDDVRAALNHHVNEGRLVFAPKVPGVSSDMRSPARDIRLTYEQLGAIIGYAHQEEAPLRWICGMLATGARPDAVLRWDLRKQIINGGDLFDTHPHGAPRTKKRNAVVPIIEPWLCCIEAWTKEPLPIVKSRKTWWRTMREALNLPAEIVPKTIRHTVATELRAKGVPQLDVEGLLGHQMSNRVTAVYAKYDPARLRAAKQALTEIWFEAWRHAELWLADHSRTTSANGKVIIVDRRAAKC